MVCWGGLAASVVAQAVAPLVHPGKFKRDSVTRPEDLLLLLEMDA